MLASPARAPLSSRPPAEILQANDLLTQGVLLYKQVMEGRVTSGDTGASAAGDAPVARGVCRAPPSLPSARACLHVPGKSRASGRSGRVVGMGGRALAPFLERGAFTTQPSRMPS